MYQTTLDYCKSLTEKENGTKRESPSGGSSKGKLTSPDKRISEDIKDPFCSLFSRIFFQFYFKKSKILIVVGDNCARETFKV